MRFLKLVQPGCLLAIAALAVAGCSEDDQPKKQPADKSAEAGAHREKWLLPSSRISAAQWLASRHNSEVRPADDPDVKQIAADLVTANRIYRESERMIANRVAQLEDMMRDIGEDERAADILNDLTRVAGEVGQTEGFGALSQHYYNLRSNKIERGEALATLKTRYGSRK